MTSMKDKKEQATLETNYMTINQNIYFSRVVNKISNSGVTVNKRILQLEQDQLKYYNHYKSFKEDQPVEGKYKQGIQISGIDTVTTASNKKNRILIEFKKKSLFEETSKSKFNPKEQEQIAKWEFVCDKQEQADQIVQMIKQAQVSLNDEQNQQKNSEMNSNNKILQKKETNMKNLQKSTNDPNINEEEEEDNSSKKSDEGNQRDLKQKIKNNENKTYDDAYQQKKGNNNQSRNASILKINTQQSFRSSLNVIHQIEQNPKKDGNSQSNHSFSQIGNFKKQSEQKINQNQNSSLSHIPNEINQQHTSNDLYKINIDKVHSRASSDNDSEEEKDITSPLLDNKRKLQSKQTLPSLGHFSVFSQKAQQVPKQQNLKQYTEKIDQQGSMTTPNSASQIFLRSAASSQQSQGFQDGSQTTLNQRSMNKQHSMVHLKTDTSLGNLDGSPYHRQRGAKHHTYNSSSILSYDNYLSKEDNEKKQVMQSAENSHEFRYHNFLEACMKAEKLDDQIKEGTKLLLYLGEFRQKAIDAAKALIADLTLPSKSKSKYEPRFKSMTAIPEIEKQFDLKNTQSTKSQSPSKKNQSFTREQQHTDPNKEPDEDDMFYIHDKNVIAKVFYIKHQTVFPSRLTNTITFDKDGVNYYDSSSFKYGGDQFRVLKQISNSYIKIRKQDPTYSLRVPLSVIVEYLGFKILIISRPQYESNVVYGPVISEKDGSYQEYKKKHQNKIEEDAAKLRERLKIKPHYFSWKNDEPIECILTFETEIHKSAGDRINKDYLKKYKQDGIVINPDKEQDQFYIEKFDDFFPINTFLDCEFDENTLRYPRRLRLEYLLKKNISLNPEAYFSQIRGGNNHSKGGDGTLQQKQQNALLTKLEKQDLIDIAELEETVAKLSTSKLFKLIQQFDNLDVILYDSQTIEECLHSNGFNMKYISHIAMHTKQPYVKLLFEQEMVARTFKKIIRRHLVLLTFQSKKNGQNQIRRQNMTSMDTSISSYEGQLKQQEKQDQIQTVIDALNMLFEDSQECRAFWKLINTQIHLEYDYHHDLCLAQFEKGGLLNAVHYSCPFLLKYGLDIFSEKQQTQSDLSFCEKLLRQIEYVDESNLFDKKIENQWDSRSLKKESSSISNSNNTKEPFKQKTQQIFKPEIFQEFICESKMFDYKDISIYQYTNLKTQSDQQKQINSIKIQKRISQFLNSEYKERFSTLYQIAKKYFMIGQYQKCIKKINQCISCLQFYPSALLVDPLCLLIKCYIILKEKQKVQFLFWKTEEIIDFNLGKMHPLHQTLLNIMAIYYESVGQYDEQIILLKASCKLIQKIVGSNHRRTAQAMLELANIQRQQGMTLQAIGYYENSFFIFQALKGEQNKRSADIGYKLALETFNLRDLEKSKKFSTYCLQFYDGKEQIYINKIIDLKIIQMKINKVTLENISELIQELYDIWAYMYKINCWMLVHVQELLKEQIEVYLKVMTENSKVFLSSQFEQIINKLIKLNVLDSLQVVENQEKSKEIIMKEIIDNKQQPNNPFFFIQNILDPLAEYAQKNPNNNFEETQPDANKEDELTFIGEKKQLFEHLMCLIGVSFFKTTFLQNLI